MGYFQSVKKPLFMKISNTDIRPFHWQMSDLPVPANTQAGASGLVSWQSAKFFSRAASDI